MLGEMLTSHAMQRTCDSVEEYRTDDRAADGRPYEFSVFFRLSIELTLTL